MVRCSIRIGKDFSDTWALTTEGLGISPVINSASQFKNIVAQILDHIDGYMVCDEQGRFGVDLVRGPSGNEPTLDEDDLIEPPSIGAVSWWDTVNEVYVRFSNRARKFADDSVSWRDRGSYAIVGTTRSTSVSRPWVTRQKVAWMIAASICRREALPHIEGTMRVKKSSAATLDAGSLFKLSYATNGLANVLCRVIEKTFQAPEHPYVTLRWKEDRGYLNANFADVAEDAALMEDTFEPAELSATLAVELPFGYTQTYQPRVALLPVRGDPLSNGWNGYWRTDESSYDQIGTSAVFAMRGTLQTAFPATVLREDDFAELDVLLEAPDRTLEGVSYATALARAPIQVFVGSEIMLGYTATLVAAGRYRLKVLRARYGTRRGEHALNEPVFIAALGANPIFIRDVPWRGQPMFEFFKCQPFLLRAELDLEEVEPATVRVVWRAYRPPPPANLRVFGDGHCPTYSTGQDIVADWDVASDARSFTPAPQDLPAQADRTVLVITSVAGTELAEIAVAGAAGPHTIANADLVAALGSETTFLLRAYSERSGYRSLTFDQVPVTRV